MALHSFKIPIPLDSIALGCSSGQVLKFHRLFPPQKYSKTRGVIGRRKTPWTCDRTNQSQINQSQPMNIIKKLTSAFRLVPTANRRAITARTVVLAGVAV